MTVMAQTACAPESPCMYADIKREERFEYLKRGISISFIAIKNTIKNCLICRSGTSSRHASTFCSISFISAIFGEIL
jgi:hypothetical protein